MSVRAKIEELIGKSDKFPYPIHEHSFAAPSDIAFTAEVRAACEKNFCGKYGKCWTCPPGAGDWRQLRDHFLAYSGAFVFTTKHELEDSFDVEGMEEGRKQHAKLENMFEKELKKLGKRFEIAGVGGCGICEKCTYPDAPCRFPEKARRSMEACGMDVVRLSRELGMHYINGENTVTYFSVIFW